jgi:HlyD family secretion protein
MLRLRQLLPRAISAGGAVAAADDVMPLAVLEFQSPTAAIVATSLPAMAKYTNWVITGLVASILLICAVMPVDRIVSGTGVLISTAPDSTIQAYNASSIVQSISVHAGELVTKGQVLATLNPTNTAADFQALTQQAQGYAAQVAQLQAQEDGKPYLGDPANPASALQLQTYNQQVGQYNFTMQDYAQKISALQSQIKGYNDQMAYYKQRLSIASNVEGMRKDLQHLQVGSKLDTLAATDERVNVQSELANALSSAQTDERQLASQEAERDAFDQQWRANISTQLATALNNLAQAQQQLAKAKLANQLVALTAPQDSIVQSVAPISPGSVLAAGQTLMSLAPINAPLSVEADIDGTESGYVHVGDSVVIKFQTLPFLEYGMAKGTVTSISPESFNPLDQQAAVTNGAPLPGGPQTLYYKAEISLDVLNLHNTPPGFQLVPGMPLQADVKVGTRTVLGYFTRRILPVAYNSLHEP